MTRRPPVAAALALALCFGSSAELAYGLARPKRADQPLGGRFPALRRTCADLFWITAVHDFPYNARDLGPRRVAVDRSRIALAVALDPDFKEIYPSAPAALLLWNDSAAARAILDAGIARFPADGWLRLLRGAYTRLIVDRDASGAIPDLEAAAHLPGAPPFVLQLLALAYHRAGRDDRAGAALAILETLGGEYADWAAGPRSGRWP